MHFTPIIVPWVWQLLLLCDWPVTHPAVEYINPWYSQDQPSIVLCVQGCCWWRRCSSDGRQSSVHTVHTANRDQVNRQVHMSRLHYQTTDVHFVRQKLLVSLCSSAFRLLYDDMCHTICNKIADSEATSSSCAVSIPGTCSYTATLATCNHAGMLVVPHHP